MTSPRHNPCQTAAEPLGRWVIIKAGACVLATYSFRQIPPVAVRTPCAYPYSDHPVRRGTRPSPRNEVAEPAGGWCPQEGAFERQAGVTEIRVDGDGRGIWPARWLLDGQDEPCSTWKSG